VEAEEGWYRLPPQDDNENLHEAQAQEKTKKKKKKKSKAEAPLDKEEALDEHAPDVLEDVAHGTQETASFQGEDTLQDEPPKKKKKKKSKHKAEQ